MQSNKMVEVKKRAVDGEIGDVTKKKQKVEHTVKKTVKPKFSKKFVSQHNDKKNKKFLNKGKPNFKGKGFQHNPKTNADGKTDWNDLKAKKKELKTLRKKQKVKDEKLYELSVQAKQLYEKLKCKATTNKLELCSELHGLLKAGNAYPKLVHSHDIARVVQCLLKYSEAGIKKEISEILMPNISQMAMSKYAHFCVARMLKYGTKPIRSQVISGFFSNVLKLVSNAISNNLIDVAYNTHASTIEKAHMRLEFYSDLYKKEKPKKMNCLGDTWKDSPEMKNAILSSTKANLLKCANKTLVDNGLVHSVLLEYMKECQDNDREEMLQTYSGLLAHLVTTKEGCQAACLAYTIAQTKDRRAILKSLKEHVEKIANHEFGHIFLITVINSTDDTVMLNKTIYNQILTNAEIIAKNEWGRKVLEWSVAPEDTAFFHPQFISEMNDKMKHSKKNYDVRRKEILAIIEKPLCKAIENNPSFWLGGGSKGLLTCAIMKISNGEHSELAYDALAKVICDPEWKVKEVDIEEVEVPFKPNFLDSNKKIGKQQEEEQVVEPINGIEHPGLHVALKKLVKLDAQKLERDNPTFGTALSSNLTPETLEHWIPLNRACFILLNILENSNETTQKNLKSKLNKKLLKSQTHPGAKILLKKL